MKADSEILLDYSIPVMGRREALAFEEKKLGDDPGEAYAAMSRAGTGIGRCIREDYPVAGRGRRMRKLLILAGKGNNTGDALIAAAYLARQAPDIEVAILKCLPGEFAGPVQQAFVELQSLVSPRVLEWTDRTRALEAGSFDIVIDGIFGLQFRPPLRGALPEIVDWLNADPARFVAAVDLPSGVCEDPVERAVRADVTYATGMVKQPVLSEFNRQWVGRLRVVDIGFFEADRQPRQSDRVVLESVLEPLNRLRPSESHKRTFGHVLVVGGSSQMPGAAMMSIRGALQAGAGLVTAAMPAAMIPAAAAAIPEAMWISTDAESGEVGYAAAKQFAKDQASRLDAALVGPGLPATAETGELVEWFVRTFPGALVLDASALRPEVVSCLNKRDKEFGPVVLTPHPGELARLFPDCAKADLDQAIETLTRSGQVVLLLKGAVSCVHAQGKRFRIPGGGPVLARGGTGDVLAGMLLALLGQQPQAPMTVAIQAATWHVRAGNCAALAAGERALRTTEILDLLADALRINSD